MSADMENLKIRYLLLLRLVAFAFLASTGFFLVFILIMHVSEEAFPFASSANENIPFYGFLPILGVLFILAGILLRRDVEKKMKASALVPQELERRLQKMFFSVTSAFLLVQMAIVPGIAWFLMTGSTDWAVILSAASLIVFVREFPRRELVERASEGAETRISE